MKRSILFFLFILASFGLQANNAERILRFHSDIRVDTTGRIEVKEAITIHAEGDDIKRGIVRAMPLYRTDVNGRKVKIDFRILSIQRDNEPEPYNTETAGNYLDVYIGDSNVLLKPGEYTYQITYESYGHVGFFDEYDELYWNVTGNDWAFYIDNASATITLPETASCMDASCYTGRAGSSDSNCLSEIHNNIVTVSTKSRLAPNEGLTVGIAFTRDIIKRPPPPSKLEQWWETYKNIVCSIGILLLLGCYYVFTWLKVGKDPAKPVVIPTFKPPHDWSPGVVRYLYKRGYENKAFTSALVSMAVKGVIRIIYESKKYTLKVVDNTKKMSHEEESVFKALFTGNTSIDVSGTNHTKFSGATERLKSTLNTDWNIKDYYLKNIGYIVMAALLCFVLSIVYLSVINSILTFDDLAVFIPVLCLGIFMAFAALRQKSIVNYIVFGIGILIISPTTLFVLKDIILREPLIVGVFLLMLLSFGLYVYLIKAPTVLGAKTFAELEGFRMYLKTAEENRLNLLTPPERTPELFEKMLPYAIALDCENEWGKKFDSLLKQFDYQPEWYSSGQPFRPGTFTNTLGNTFNTSISQARIDPTPPSSGSSGSGSWGGGSFGGGFSGGGGGGGGGRGW